MDCANEEQDFNNFAFTLTHCYFQVRLVVGSETYKRSEAELDMVITKGAHFVEDDSFVESFRKKAKKRSKSRSKSRSKESKRKKRSRSKSPEKSKRKKTESGIPM